MSPTHAALSALVAKWRTYASDLANCRPPSWFATGHATMVTVCADELEAVLAAEGEALRGWQPMATYPQCTPAILRMPHGQRGNPTGWMPLSYTSTQCVENKDVITDGSEPL